MSYNNNNNNNNRCLRSSKCFEKSKEREETARLRGESFTWSVFETK